ncbi:ParB/RepB/Spo0J family partition protein [Nitrospira sp. BLG_2]|uniref:ParB/RepB/Spo0J family partition protein n=1 Tax=Nitrospira sp. BLG_2 TaxID=3397507 RepID=UPI003B9B13A0
MARSTKRPVFEAVDTVWAVPLYLIDPASYNPPDRLCRESLKENIKQNGQHVPIHLCWSKDGKRLELVEGHGRFGCCQELGFPTIKAIVSEYIPDELRASKYEQINSESKPHSGSDKVYEYLKCRWSVSATERCNFGRVERETGDRVVLERMARCGYGWHFFYNRCLPIGKWVGVHEDQSMFKRFCCWLMTHPAAVTECRYMLEHRREGHIDDGKAVAEILQAFRENRVPSRAKADRYACVKVGKAA